MCLTRAVLIAPVFAPLLTGCNLAVLDPRGPIAAQNKQILVGSLAIMLAIVVPTLIGLCAFAWWFRAGNSRAHRRPDFRYSGQIELVVWSIPILTVMLLGGVIWVGAHRLDPGVPVQGDAAPVRVQVVSLDWKWLFIYPDQKIVSVNQLLVPIGAPLKLELTSASVMTAFFVPQWGSMIYTMNAMTSRLNLRVDQAGDYLGIASHLSGAGFADMHFDARAMSPDAFAQWVRSAAGAPFDAEAYRHLEKQGPAEPMIRPLGDDNLFADIVSQKLAPAPGPSVSEK